MRIAVAREADAGRAARCRHPGHRQKADRSRCRSRGCARRRLGSGISDADFEAAGAKVGDAVAKDADVVLKVRRPQAAELKDYKKGALVIAIMDPYGHDAELKAMADAGVIAFAMELMRASRARSRWMCCRARRIWPAIAP